MSVLSHSCHASAHSLPWPHHLSRVATAMETMMRWWSRDLSHCGSVAMRVDNPQHKGKRIVHPCPHCYNSERGW